MASLDFLVEYINHLESNKLLSFNSLRLYKRDLLDFDSFVKEHFIEKLGHSKYDFTLMSSEDLNRFAVYIENKGGSTASVNRKLTALHGFWNWMRDQGWVKRDPFTQIKRGTQYRNKSAESLSEEEIVMLLDCETHSLKVKMILELIYATGIRVGELTKLTIADIDLTNQLITIARSSRFKERVIPFNQLLASYMENYIKTHELTENSPLLLNRKNETVSEREVFRVINQAAREAGLTKKISPSILRNSFLKHMKDNGAHETLLRDITGQKAIKL